MKIFEIGVGIGGVIKVIMKEIGCIFVFYIYIDIFLGFFEIVQQVFDSLGNKIIFKFFDCEKDIVVQGYEEYLYDMVVVFLVFYVIIDFCCILRNVCCFLKLGGFFVMQEIINNDVSCIGFMMFVMIGWWFGQDDGRMFLFGVLMFEWYQLFFECGF